MKRKTILTLNLTEYLKHYQLNINGINHNIGYVKIDRYKVFVHVLQPAKIKRTVILVHGYMVHSGIFRYLIEYLIGKEYAVICMDLPGHGLSEGRRGDIDSFGLYGRIINQIQSIIADHFQKPLYFIGHSTGCSAYLEYLYQNKSAFAGAVFLAPLIRTQFWTLFRAANKLLVPLIKSVPRFFRKTSSDKEYLDFIKRDDPLQVKIIPMGWVSSFMEWNKSIVNYPESDEKIKIIQGNKDIVVDWKYNIPFLKDKFKNSEIAYIEGGNHDLCGESRLLRTKVFKEIHSYLEGHVN